MNARLVERILVGILLVVAGGIVIHAPLTVWLGTIWPSHDLLIKSWKELLMGVALVLLIIAAIRRHRVTDFLSDRLMQLCLVYAGLHLVMMMVFQNALQTAGAGLLIDLRFILYFVLVYGTLLLYPSYKKLFISVFVYGAIIVIGFAALQFFVLPKDILSHIGYSKATIAPYLTVDENPAFIRINSTLRGPNPLGAYATIVASLLAAVAIRWKMGSKGWLLAGIGALATAVALGASYSRSSLIGAIVALLIIVVISSTKEARIRMLSTFIVGAVVIVSLLVAFRDSSFVRNVIWHDNPTTGASVDSNAGHAASLLDGTERVLGQPFGSGIGSTGSASLLGDKPLIIENHYLLVAHETGWLGLLLFVWLFIEILRRLWDKRKSALALGVFGSGVGLAIIGLLLPVWTDDTVSIVWWGLAAVAIASSIPIKKTRKKHGTRESN